MRLVCTQVNNTCSADCNDNVWRQMGSKCLSVGLYNQATHKYVHLYTMLSVKGACNGACVCVCVHVCGGGWLTVQGQSKAV